MAKIKIMDKPGIGCVNCAWRHSLFCQSKLHIP